MSTFHFSDIFIYLFIDQYLFGSVVAVIGYAHESLIRSTMTGDPRQKQKEPRTIVQSSL